MKSLKPLYILLFFLISSCVTTKDIPGSIKGDNTIIITTNQTAESAFKQLVEIVTLEGFTIENIDKELFILTTGPKNTSKLNASIKLNFLIHEKENTTIILSGLFTINSSLYLGYGVTTNFGWSRIENKGMNGSVIKVAWNDLYNIATKFPEGKILFEKR